VLRIAVAAAALVQLALALPTLVGAFLASEVGPHTGREMASFDVAVAVGFLFVAYRPARARALVPVALVLAALLGVTSSVDIVRGVAGPAHEIGHQVAIVQAALLWALSRIETGPGTRVPRPRVAGTPR
jgi:predicted anti-sigma-YlaC factor YlaD